MAPAQAARPVTEEALPRQSAANPSEATSAPSWATVSTMKESPEIVMDFIAHHLLLGACEIIIFFDDPDDPAIERVEHLPQVRAIRCDADFVAARGKHPPGLPARQKIHAAHAYAMTRADWIIHIDADEFIAADRPVGAVLAGAEADVVRLAPFEALATPDGGKGDAPEHYYRGALPRGRKGSRLAREAYAPFEHCLAQGMLSHQAGKFFVRTGIAGMALAVHGPFLNHDRAPHQETAAMRLLHFHGGVYDTWRRHLDRRLSDDAGGTYSGRLAAKGGQTTNLTLLATLQDLHRSEGEAGLERFFRVACTYGPEKRALAAASALTQANLWREAKRAAVFGGEARLRDAGFNPQTAAFEATLDWHGATLRLAPDTDYAQCLIARGENLRDEAMAALRALVAGKTLAMADLAPGAGLVALVCASAAAEGSCVATLAETEEAALPILRHATVNPGLCLQPMPCAVSTLAVLDALPGAYRVVQASAFAPEDIAGSLLAARPDLVILDAGRRAHALKSDLAARFLAQGYVATATSGAPLILDRNPEVQS